MNVGYRHLLLVEDDDVAAEGVARAVSRSGLDVELHRARDGVEGLEALRGTSDRAPLPRPHLLLVDLRMPRMDGVQFLRELRRDPKLSSSVVFLLTTSTAARDLEAAYEHQVAGYIPKSTLEPGLENLVALLSAYGNVVQLPGGPGPKGGTP